MSAKFDRYEVDDSDDYYVDERTVKGTTTSTEVMKMKNHDLLQSKTRPYVYTAAPVAGGWAGAVMSWAGTVS